MNYFSAISLSVVFFLSTGHARSETAGEHQWLSVPITVAGVPPRSEFLPVSAHIDLSALLQEFKRTGLPDERLLRLVRLDRDARTEIPFQFRSDMQPRPRDRRNLPGTRPQVSYLSEYSAGETPAAGLVAGELTWIVSAPASGAAEYLLEFAVRSRGRMVQVPFPPQNFRGFDDSGSGTRIPWFPQMRLSPQWPFEGVVNVFQNQQLITTYHQGPRLDRLDEKIAVRRPFFYPVYGPDGFALTEFGKPHDPTGSHAHHYSLWVAHHDVDGQSFWGETGGVIAHEQFELMEDGPIFCRLAQKARWINKGVEVLHEKRRVTVFHEADGFRIIDLSLDLMPASEKPVVFGKTSFGFLAVRVAQSMTPFDGAGEIRNSHDDLNEQNAHLKRAEWIDQSGPVAPGQWGGIAIFDHPDNPGHPNGWHCRNDGWAGASFNMDNAYTLKAGETLKLKYRIHLHRHNALEGRVQKRFEEYAARPAVTLGKVTETQPSR